MTNMETNLICALAAIDAALGMPEDGCNSTEATITAIKLLHAAHEDDQKLITTLRQRIADLESAQTFGAADRVILHAMDGREMTVVQIESATGMTRSYVAQRVYRLAAMGRVEKCGMTTRPDGGSGKNPVLWRIKA